MVDASALSLRVIYHSKLAPKYEFVQEKKTWNSLFLYLIAIMKMLLGSVQVSLHILVRQVWSKGHYVLLGF